MICTLFTEQNSKEGIFMRYSYELNLNLVGHESDRFARGLIELFLSL